MEKRGISPVIATTLLIAIVVILGAIIFLWARGFVNEQAEKFGAAVELSCDDVVFEAGTYSCPGAGCELDIVNRGNIPIYGVDVKQRRSGDVFVHEIADGTVGIGESVTVDLSGVGVSSGDELNVVPIILGSTDSGRVAHTCADQYGYTVVV